MNCVLEGDRIDAEDVGDWSVSKTLTGGANARIQLCSPEGKYSVELTDLRGAVVVIKAIVNSVEYTMFMGRVRTVGETYEVNGEEKVDIDCSSIMALAFRRPITAETINGAGEDIMRYILTEYGGIDDCWIGDLDDNATNFTYVNFSENSIIAGLRKIAEACRVELYVNKEGKLVTEAKKDFNDTVEYDIQQADIFKMSRTFTELEVPSVCRVRGRYIAFTEAGTETYVTSSSYDAVADSPTQLIMRIRPIVDVSAEMALQATVSIVSGATNGEVLGRKDNGDLFVQFDGTFTPNVVNTIEFGITGPSYRNDEFVTDSVRAIGEGLNENIYNRDGNGTVFPFTSYDRNNPDTQLLNHYDEPNTSRIELVTKDDKLLSQHGVVYMAIDNTYIQTSVDAQLIGDRALFEKAVARSRVKISGPFNENLLEPNKIVTLPLMYRTDEVIKGLLTAVTFSYRQDPRSLIASYEIGVEVPDYAFDSDFIEANPMLHELSSEMAYEHSSGMNYESFESGD